ncbi:MAG: hypothetical protein QOD59_4934, partial [Mycobacterium sp.]|nr:hypothetical protein [Mycobacterium sp.]
MSKSDDEQRIIFRENVIRVGTGFVAKERPFVLDSLSTLGPHLGRWEWPIKATPSFSAKRSGRPVSRRK